MSDEKFKLNLLAVAVMGLGLSIPNIALSQSGLVLEEVIVTAQKKEQTLSEAPLTVNIISGDQIRDMNMFQATDLSKITAGVEVRNEGDSNSGVALRGVGTLTQQAAPSRVGTYLDDWYVGAQTNFAFKQMFDIQNIQILRGPQGTLYGQPSPTGALIMTTADPNLSEFEGFISATYQDPAGYNVQGAVSIPLIENELGLRIAVLLDERETGLENITRNLDNEINNTGYRIKLLWEPNDVFSAKLGWTHVESDDSDTYRPVQSISPDAPHQLDPSDRTAIQDSPDQMNEQENDLYTLHMDWDAGPVELKLFMAHHDLTTDSASDQDVIDLPVQTVAVHTEGVDDQQVEFRVIASPFEWWDTQVGLYYSDVANQTDVPIFFNVPSSGLVAAITLDIPTESETSAIFTHNDFYISDDTTLTVGIRYTEFDNSSENNQSVDLLIGSEMLPGGEITEPVVVVPNPCPDGSPSPCVLAGGSIDKEWTGTIKLAHAFSENHNFFATYDSGFRPGAPNFDTQAIIPEEHFFYGGESVDSVEIGFKGTLMDGRAQYTFAVYYSLYENYQVIPSYQVWNPVSSAPADVTIVYVNVDEAEQLGWEGEFRILLTENWSLFSSLAWSQVEFTDGEIPCNDPSQPPLGPDNSFNVCDADGEVAGDQPDWSWVLQSEYRVPMDTLGGEWYISGLFNYRGESEVPGDSDGRLTTDDYYMLDLFTGIRTDTWSVKAFVMNVLDDDEIISQRAVGENYNDLSLIQTRTTGVTFSYYF